MSLSISPYQIILVASKLFLEQGYEEVSMAQIARHAAIEEASLFTHFGSKQDIILAIYQSINADWQLAVGNIGSSRLGERFEQAMTAKIGIMQPFAPLLGTMLGLLLQHNKIGIQSPRTSHIRAVGLQTMQAIIGEAGDSKTLSRKLPQLPSLLYTIHWAILFLFIHTGDKAKTVEALEIINRLLRRAGSMSQLLRIFPFFKEIGDWAGSLLNTASESSSFQNREILKIIFNNRKTSHADPACIDGSCDACISLHEARVLYFTDQQKPLHFILPAFPAKSPNHAKVLGKLPDLGEEIALKNLEDMCVEIATVYKPGAHITICSDGRIFSELVDVSDEDVTQYVAGIKAIIERLALRNISIVNLEHLMEGTSFETLREQVITRYAEPLESLRERLKSSTEFKALFNGMHRFITEDRKVVYPGLSVSKVKHESAAIALEVIRHSNAWTRFLAYVYPDAIRLSIHPYPAHSDKIGIQLTKAADNWLTPWHGVIVLGEDGYVLTKRDAAEAQGARLIFKDGQPYYYTLIPQ